MGLTQLTNPSRGASSQSSGPQAYLGDLKSRSKALNVGCRQLVASTSGDGNGTSPGKTYVQKMALPSVNILAVRGVYLNTQATPITGVKVIASSSTSKTEAYNNGGAWTAGTFGGASTGTFPAGTTLAPSVTRTDWISVLPLARQDGLAGALFHLRTFIPNTNTTVTTVASNGAGGDPPVSATWDAIAGQEWRCAVNVGDFVASPTTFTAAGEGIPALAGIEYLMPSGAVHIMRFGDSIHFGAKASAPGNNELVIAAASGSSNELPISLQNISQAGTTSDTYISLAETLIPAQRPAIAVYAVFSPNDGTPTAAIIRLQKVKRARFLKICRDNDVVPVLCTSTPNTNAANTASTYTAAQDDLVKALDDETRAMCGMGLALLMDSSLIMSDAQTTGRARLWKASFTADGLHPIDAAYSASAVDMSVGAGAVIAYVTA